MTESLASMKNRGLITHSTIIKGANTVIGIGSCAFDIEESSTIRPEKTSFVIDGTLPGNLESEEIGGEVSQESLVEALQAPNGFSLVAISEGRLLAARDMLGQTPLYHGSNGEGTVVVASLKKALTTAGIKRFKPVPPGQLVAFSKRGTSAFAGHVLSRPREIKVKEDDAVGRLTELLVESLSTETSQDIALAFSGGLDSTLVAQAAKENDLRPELITVGLKGQRELVHARKVSKEIGLDIIVKELSKSEVLEALPAVVDIIESTDPVLVGVSVPLYFVCEVAKQMGADCLLAGQLSDELFAGYGRFDALARKKDARMVRDEIWKSVLAASTNDFETGDKLAVSHRLRLRCPFAFVRLVEYALRLPTSLKLRVVAGQVVRKYILRRLAADWGLPEQVTNRPKKAVQYSTGVQKVLLQEAKKRGMALSGFLESFL